MDNNELLSQISQLMDIKLNTLKTEIDAKVEAQGNALEERFTAKLDALRTEIKDENQKLLMSIVDVVESQATKLGLQYEHNVDSRLKALNEESDILRDDIQNHEQRIHTVERKVGIAI